MATRKELEEEWIEYERWKRSQSLEFSDYLEHRDRVIAQENLNTLRDFIEELEDEDSIHVWKLKEILRRA